MIDSSFAPGVLQEVPHCRSSSQVSVLQQNLHQHDQVPLPPENPPQQGFIWHICPCLHGSKISIRVHNLLLHPHTLTWKQFTHLKKKDLKFKVYLINLIDFVNVSLFEVGTGATKGWENCRKIKNISVWNFKQGNISADNRW